MQYVAYLKPLCNAYLMKLVRAFQSAHSTGTSVKGCQTNTAFSPRCANSLQEIKHVTMKFNAQSSAFQRIYFLRSSIN